MSTNTSKAQFWLNTPHKPLTNNSPKKGIGLYTLYLLLPGLMLSILKIATEGLNNVNWSNLLMFASILTYAILLFTHRAMFTSWVHQQSTRLTKTDVRFVFLMYGILFIGNLVIGLFRTSVPANQDALTNAFGTGSIILFGIFTVVLAPLVEEMLFRQVFFRSIFVNFTGLWVFILNILLFTVLHTGPTFFSDPVGTVQYAWISFIFAFTYVKSRSFDTSYFLHLLNNLVAFAVLVITFLMS